MFLAAAGASNLALAAQQQATGLALTPGLAPGNNFTHFNTMNSVALFWAGIEPLPPPFNMKVEQVIIFVKDLASKVGSMGWNKGIKNITTHQNLTIDLICEYGQIDYQIIKTACKNFVKETGAIGQQYVHRITCKRGVV